MKRKTTHHSGNRETFHWNGRLIFFCFTLWHIPKRNRLLKHTTTTEIEILKKNNQIVAINVKWNKSQPTRHTHTHQRNHKKYIIHFSVQKLSIKIEYKTIKLWNFSLFWTPVHSYAYVNSICVSSPFVSTKKQNVHRQMQRECALYRCLCPVVILFLWVEWKQWC